MMGHLVGFLPAHVGDPNGVPGSFGFCRRLGSDARARSTLSLSLPLTNIPSPNLATLKKLKKQHKVNLPGRRLSSLRLLKSQKARNQSAVYKLRTMEYPTQ